MLRDERFDLDYNLQGCEELKITTKMRQKEAMLHRETYKHILGRMKHDKIAH